MQGSGSLLSQLHADEFDEAELRILISSHFGHGVWATSKEVHYSSTQGGDAALILSYDSGGELTEIAPGPALDERSLSQLVAAIESERYATDTDIARTCLFAAVPTRSQWRFADSAAIIPAPPGAPQPQEVLADHPFILEVRHRNSVSPRLRGLRSRRVLRCWELLLCVIVGWGIHSLGLYTTKRWVLTDTHGTLADVKPAFLQVGYFVPGYQAAEAEFSSGDSPRMLSVQDDQFYARRGISVDDSMAMPHSLPRALQRYRSLPSDEQRRFLRACFWFQLSERQWELSRSASYQSLVQAIEALLPRRSVDRCAECDRPLEGPTRAFKDFVETYAAWTTSSERDEFYRLRSSVAHGSILFESDVELDFGGLRPLMWQQHETHGRMTQVARVALVNYLLRV